MAHDEKFEDVIKAGNEKERTKFGSESGLVLGRLFFNLQHEGKSPSAT